MIAMLRHVAEKETCIGYEYFFYKYLKCVETIFIPKQKKEA